MLRKGQKSKILDSRFSRIRVRDRRENDDPVISRGVRRGENPRPNLHPHGRGKKRVSWP